MNDSEKPKIYVDEDWKSQVEREKEQAKSQPADSAAGQTPSDQSEAGMDSGNAAASGEGIPEASLEMLIASLATQATIAMGLAPGAESQEVNLPLTQHCIDMLGVLETKTSGNRTAQEDQLLENVLHQLRLAFLERKQQGGTG